MEPTQQQPKKKLSFQEYMDSLGGSSQVSKTSEEPAEQKTLDTTVSEVPVPTPKIETDPDSTKKLNFTEYMASLGAAATPETPAQIPPPRS